MKKLSTIIATGAIALTLSSSAFAGPVGVSRAYATQVDPQTIAELQQASEAAQREARTGNKDNLAFGQKSYQIDSLIGRMQSGQQVDQAQIDNALQPVRVW
jgi:hypothetical protein